MAEHEHAEGFSETSGPDEQPASRMIASEPEELSQGTKTTRWPFLVAIVVAGAVAAGLLVARPGSGHPTAASTPVAPATTPADSSVAALVPVPTTPPPAPEKITTCSQYDPELHADIRAWQAAMNAPDATFASRASATSLLTSQAFDTSTGDTTIAGNSFVPDAVDASLLEQSLVPLEDDLPLNQPTGLLPDSYPSDVQRVVAAAALFSAC